MALLGYFPAKPGTSGLSKDFIVVSIIPSDSTEKSNEKVINRLTLGNVLVSFFIKIHSLWQ